MYLGIKTIRLAPTPVDIEYTYI